MDNSILVVYKSSTGNTKKYAEMIAEQLNCKILSFSEIGLDIINEYDTVIFGTRIVAGHIDDITRVLKLIEASHINHLILFATGATPTENESIKKAWEVSLTKEQLKKYPHYYFPGGLNYEQMSLSDKAMMNTLKLYLKFKRNKTQKDRDLESMIAHSYDLINKDHIQKLINDIK